MNAPVLRLIAYEFDDQEELARQLGRSMPDGTREFGHGKRIRVLTLPPQVARAIGSFAQWSDETIYRELDEAYGEFRLKD